MFPGDNALRQLGCTCVWSEVDSALQHFAYGDPSDDDLIAFAPVLAALASDAAYRARTAALARRQASST